MHMENISTVTENCKPPVVEADELREFMMTVLRCGSLRARLIANELDAVRVAVNSRWMTPRTALQALDEISVCDLPVWHFIPEIGVP
jgi:hypothetical protein